MDKVRDDHYRLTKGEVPRRTAEGEPILPTDQYTPMIITNDRRRKGTEENQPGYLDVGRNNEFMVGLRAKNSAYRVQPWPGSDIPSDSDTNRDPM